MYKKITHNIVEEHFDHPVASQIKKSMEKSRIVTNEVFSESKFRTDVHEYFSKYQIHLNNLINSATSTDEEFLNAFDNIFKTSWIDDLGNMVKPIYVMEFGERINQGMRMFATGVFLVLQSLKIGKDSGFNFNRLNFAVNDITQNLSNFNSNWSFPVVSPLLNKLATDIFAQAKARISKNSDLELQQAQKVAEGFSTLESVFVEGVIKQYPERFNNSTLAQSFNNKDIM